jgi:catechol 2,3-dioxygenase-like lactoylglutathione lyase family enzyme
VRSRLCPESLQETFWKRSSGFRQSNIQASDVDSSEFAWTAVGVDAPQTSYVRRGDTLSIETTVWRLENMALKRMDNVGIVVEDLGAAIDFFSELGLELEGRAMVEGEWARRITGLGDQHVEIAMMRTPDGHSRLELSRFLKPDVVADHRNAPVNALGYLRVMFAVDDIDETLERLSTRGAQLVGEVVQYKDAYRLCYIRGPEGILIGIAQELG